MTFEYRWLRILDVLMKAHRPLRVEDISAELKRRGFLMDRTVLLQGLDRLRAQELVDVLILAGGTSEGSGTFAITEKGERKVRSIVRM